MRGIINGLFNKVLGSGRASGETMMSGFSITSLIKPRIILVFGIFGISFMLLILMPLYSMGNTTNLGIMQALSKDTCYENRSITDFNYDYEDYVKISKKARRSSSSSVDAELASNSSEYKNREEFNQHIKEMVDSAGYGTRAGVVAAAMAFAGDYPKTTGIKLRYYSDSGTTNKEQKPETEGIKNDWFGMSCNNFVYWSIYNGGFNLPNEVFYGNRYAQTYKWPGWSERNNYNIDIEDGQPGDVLWKFLCNPGKKDSTGYCYGYDTAHYVLIVGKYANGYYVAHEHGGNSSGIMAIEKYTFDFLKNDKYKDGRPIKWTVTDMTEIYENPKYLREDSTRTSAAVIDSSTSSDSSSTTMDSEAAKKEGDCIHSSYNRDLTWHGEKLENNGGDLGAYTDAVNILGNKNYRIRDVWETVVKACPKTKTDSDLPSSCKKASKEYNIKTTRVEESKVTIEKIKNWLEEGKLFQAGSKKNKWLDVNGNNKKWKGNHIGLIYHYDGNYFYMKYAGGTGKNDCQDRSYEQLNGRYTEKQLENWLGDGSYDTVLYESTGVNTGVTRTVRVKVDCDTQVKNENSKDNTIVASGDRAKIVERAKSQMGKPYVWGATGPDSYDCSGLVGYALTGKYERIGTTETFMGWSETKNPQPGDICVSWEHTGIYIGNGEMIHAPETGDVVKIGPVQAGMKYVVSPYLKEDSSKSSSSSNSSSSGEHLTAQQGVFNGPSGKETYYNLDMSGVVANAKAAGAEGDYWVRDDGCKMLGKYIMVAANQNVHPYKSIVKTSLGDGIVVDTGGFAQDNPNQLDIAVTW